MKNVLIIGAGGTGRGFIPRLLKNESVSITFVDINDELINQLVTQGKYSIFVGEKMEEVVIDSYEAFQINDIDALNAGIVADVIFVSVGVQNLGGLKDFFSKLAEHRKIEGIKVIVAENGISPRNAFIKALDDNNLNKMLISQAIIFCTSIPINKNELDIVSEDYPSMPYDNAVVKIDLPFSAFVPTDSFSILMQRKIYTYNCLSGCIAYPGYVKNYISYADAANDREIVCLCKKVRESLDRVIGAKYNVPPEEQREFSERALRKFRNYAIKDTVAKNTRAVIRKLGPEERLIGPLQLLNAEGEDVTALLWVISSALVYLCREEEMSYKGIVYSDPICVLNAINSNNEIPKEQIDEIEAIYNNLVNGSGYYF